MSTFASQARDNGWMHALLRAGRSAPRRLRDLATARKLRTSGFHCGQAPRLLGLRHMRIGANFRAGDHLWLEAISQWRGERFHPELVIGDNVNVSDRVHIGCLASVTIGSGTLIGSGVLISDHTHGRYTGGDQSEPEIPPNARALHSAAPVRIGRNVWIGDQVCILAGADIGDGAIIGAGSVVTGAIPAGCIAFGSPARVRRRWDAATSAWQPLPPNSAV